MRLSSMKIAIGLGWAATLGGVLVASAASAACLGDPAAQALPTVAVQSLRSYRVDFRAPTRLAIDPSGAVYVADPERGEVVVREPDGRIRDWRSGLGRVSALAVDAAGRVYLGNADSGEVVVYDAGWRRQHALGAGPGEFGLAGDIAIDSASGRVYVTDSRNHEVRVYDGGGAALFSFGGEGSGDGQFRFPSGIFVDEPRAELLVVDQLNYRVQVFGLDGGFRFCLAGGGTRPGSFFQSARALSVPQGVWADAEGRVYVADASEGQVRVLDRRGAVIQAIGAFGQRAGELRIPMDLALDGNGRLFVSAANNARLEMYGLGAFSDVEQFAPALVVPDRESVDLAGDEPLALFVRVPGYRAAEVGSLRANGVAPTQIDLGDFDGDGEADLHAVFALADLAPALPPAGVADLTVTGVLPALELEGRTQVTVLPAAPLDGDGDGVADDLDQCPGTGAGATVDGEGCAVADLCPCGADPQSGLPWRNHGRYVRCVVHAARDFTRAGLIDRAERRELVRNAAHAECGRRHWARKADRERDNDHERDRDEDHDDRGDKGHEKSKGSAGRGKKR